MQILQLPNKVARTLISRFVVDISKQQASKQRMAM